MLSAFSNVILYAPKSFLQGESVVFTLEAKGSSNIDFPTISKVDGFAVQSAGTSNSYSSINGKITQKISQQYQFFPTRTVTLPSFEVKVDGKSFYTQEHTIQKDKVSKTQSNLFDLDIKVSKTQAYVGEMLLYTIIFKYDQNVSIEKMGLNMGNFTHFWSKKVEKNRQYQEGNFIVQELDFLLFAQKSGALKLDAISIDMLLSSGNRNAFSLFNNQLEKKRIFSNDLTLDIKPLPKGVALIGDFTLKSSVDKTKVNQGEAVSYKIHIQGKGNIDDVPDIKLSYKNATVYENEPIVKTFEKEGEYQGSWTKSFSIIPSSDMTIDSVTLEYFNAQSGTIKKVKSQSFDIQVQAKKKDTPLLEKQRQVQPSQTTVQKEPTSFKERWIYFILGTVNALLMVGLYKWNITRQLKKSMNDCPLNKRIKMTKNQHQLLRVMLPFIHDNIELQEKIQQLEEKNVDFKALKKEILHLVETKQIKDRK